MSLRSTAFAVLPKPLRPYWRRLEASPLGSRLARGAFWALSGAIVSRALGLTASVLVARLLGLKTFGELGVVQSTTSLFGMLAGFGLGLTATKQIAEFRTKDPVRAGRILTLSAVIAWTTGALSATMLLLLGPWMAHDMLAAAHLGDELRVCALLVLFGAVNGAQVGALAGFEAFKVTAISNLLAGVSSFILITLGAWWRGLGGAVWGMAASSAITTLVNHMALRQQLRRSGVALASRHWLREWRVLVSFSLPAVLSSLLYLPAYWAANAIIVNGRQVNGYAEMGIFNAANQWFNLVIFLPETLGPVVLPVLSERVSAGAWGDIRKLMRYMFLVVGLVMLPLIAVLCLISKPIMGMYGEDCREGWPVMAVVLATGLLYAVQYPAGRMIMAGNRMWTSMAMTFGWAIIFVGLTLVLVNYGAMGLATSRAVAYAAHAAWSLVIAWRICRGSKPGSKRPLDNA